MPRRFALIWAAALAVVLASCTSTVAATPGSSPQPTTSPSPGDSPVATPSPSAPPSPTPTPESAEPTFVPALAAIQMVGPRFGWAVGAHAIYATGDGAHWTKQFASTEEFVGVDFISVTTGWAVGARSLLGTSDGGRTWHQLGEPDRPIRSVNFVSPSQGWGIAGGTDPQAIHGWLVPKEGATLVTTRDGGVTWTSLGGPPNPQTVCFSDSMQGWVGTQHDGVYRYQNIAQGQSWSKALQRPDQPAADLGPATVIQCAGPRSLWVLFLGGGAAMSHSPYIAYATTDGSSWRAVLNEPMTVHQAGVPAGPDSYPPSFSVVDPGDAGLVGDGPATNVAQCVIASGGGTTLRCTGAIQNATETFAAAFVSLTTGWVLTRNGGGDYVIDATTDGGYHWSEQLAIPPTSAG